MNTLENDPRWVRLHDKNWKCPCCGDTHQGLFDLACNKPDFWQGNEEYRPNSEVWDQSDILTEDFCVINNEYFFVRCVLKLPIIGISNEFFGFGAWSSLSEENFRFYLDHFDEGQYRQDSPWFGWFSNCLKGYPDTLNLKADVFLQDGRQRPYIKLQDIDHPLVEERYYV